MRSLTTQCDSCPNFCWGRHRCQSKMELVQQQYSSPTFTSNV